MSDGEESSPLVVETDAAASPMRYSQILRDGAVAMAAVHVRVGVFLACVLKRCMGNRDLDAAVAVTSNKRRLMLVSVK